MFTYFASNFCFILLPRVDLLIVLINCVWISSSVSLSSIEISRVCFFLAFLGTNLGSFGARSLPRWELLLTTLLINLVFPSLVFIYTLALMVSQVSCYS